jgi:hypothetical protein
VSRRLTAQGVLGDFPAPRIAVEAEDIGGLAQVPIGRAEYVGDELLLELASSVFETHAAGHHFVDQPFELFFQHHEAVPPVATRMFKEGPCR